MSISLFSSSSQPSTSASMPELPSGFTVGTVSPHVTSIVIFTIPSLSSDTFTFISFSYSVNSVFPSTSCALKYIS